ncbi:MAG: hypothetical protein K2N16_06515 [Muribaculaceae bacterium]|nr:hypothetical protein [Muribaculaceae bacterium]
MKTGVLFGQLKINVYICGIVLRRDTANQGNLMAQTNKYLEGFHDWWTKQGHASRSADLYRSGIRRVNDEFFVPVVHKDMFDVLDDAISVGNAVDWLTALIGSVSARIEQTDDVTVKKRLQDNRSQLKRFVEYVAELQESVAESGVNGIDLIPGSLPDGKQYYARETLAAYVVRRLGLADYMNVEAEIFLPMRILGRLYSAVGRHDGLLRSMGMLEANGLIPDLGGWYRGWLEQRAMGVVFHTAKGDYRLSEVSGLLIDAKRRKAWIRASGKDIPMLVEHANGRLSEASIASIAGLRLASAEPIADTLSHLSPVLPTLRQFTGCVKDAFRGRTVHIKKFNFNMVGNGERYYDVNLALDQYLPRDFSDAAVWFCGNVDWRQIAPLLSLLRIELNYVAAATRLVANTSIK